MANKSGIHIKKSHEGLFTARANRQGHSMSEQISKDLHSGGNAAKQANFARMARRGWKPLGSKHEGGPIDETGMYQLHAGEYVMPAGTEYKVKVTGQAAKDMITGRAHGKQAGEGRPNVKKVSPTVVNDTKQPTNEGMGKVTNILEPRSNRSSHHVEVEAYPSACADGGSCGGGKAGHYEIEGNSVRWVTDTDPTSEVGRRAAQTVRSKPHFTVDGANKNDGSNKNFGRRHESNRAKNDPVRR